MGVGCRDYRAGSDLLAGIRQTSSLRGKELESQVVGGPWSGVSSWLKLKD